MLNQDYLNDLKQSFKYDDGVLFRRFANGRLKKAGYITTRGYSVVVHKEKKLQTHRVIFFLCHGYLPEIVDHIDCNPSNNQIENLRAATPIQSSQNRRVVANKPGNEKNVYPVEGGKKFKVQIVVNKKAKYFGTYFDKNVAIFVADTMRHKYHGQFANSGFKDMQ